MSREDVELVRSIWAAWERGDLSSAEWADPAVEYVTGDGPIQGHWKGLSAMAQAGRENVEAWEDFRFSVDEYRDLGDGRVLVLFRYSGRGKRSGLEIGRLRAEGVGLFEIRAGKVIRVVQYWNRERGLAELGLAPDPGTRA